MANTTVVVPSIAQDSSGNVTSTGQFFGANGTAAAPSFAFTNATGTGMYRPSANALAFSTNGTLALTISTAQLATFAGAVIVNGSQGVYIKGGNGTASPIADTNVPLQIDSGTAGNLKVSYFGANKNGGYGVLFGYSNDTGATGGVGGQFRMVTTDPFSIVVNNSVLAAQWLSTGALALQAGANSGASLNLKSVTASTTLSGATTNLVQIPAGAIVMGVSARVTTLVTSGDGATTWTLGDGTTADLYGTSLAFAANTTVTNTNYKSTFAPKIYTGATSTVATATGGTFSGGVVRTVVWYHDVTAPTA